MRCFLLAVMLSGVASPAFAEEITISLQGVKKNTGSVVLCLWDKDDGFPNCEKGKPLRRIVVPARSTSARFENVLPGTYAVSAFHDANGNGQLDSNFIGLPLEAVGMSNNPKLKGPPRFKPTQFRVAGATTISIKLQSM